MEADTRCVITRLFEDGSYEVILNRIFRLLDGASIESCSLVCKKWNEYIRNQPRQETGSGLRLEN